MQIAMVGSGYVGLVSGACFADFGHTGHLHRQGCRQDRGAEARRDADLRAGPRPSWSTTNVRAEAARALPTDLVGRCARREAVFIAVGTPSRRGDGHADLTYVYQAAREIAPRRSTASRSSSPNRRCRSAPATRSSGSSARRGRMPISPVVSNPEFLREGAAIQDFKHPDRIVVGTEDERAEAVMREIYRPLYLNQAPILCHQPAHRRTDQIRRQRLSRHQDHLHQRDRRPVRRSRRRRAGGRARHRPRQPHRRRNSCMPARASAARAFPRTRWR